MSGTGPGSSAADAFDRAAGPAAAFAVGVAELARGDPALVLREGRALLDRFADDLRAAGVPRAAVPPARLALALLIDRAGRSNSRLSRAQWSGGAHRLLFEGEEMSPARLRAFVAQAEGAGPAFAGAAAFLSRCLREVEGARAARDGAGRDDWAASLAAGLVGLLLLGLGWTIHAEWAFHRDAGVAFAAEALPIGLDLTVEIRDLPERLDDLADAVRRAEGTAGRAPVWLLAGPLGFDAGDRAQAELGAALARHLPPVLADAIDTALASEGEAAEIDDTLRAWAILSGRAPWDAGYLAGWLEDRAELLPRLQRLVPHVAALGPPAAPPEPPDARLLDLARDLAAETRAEDRAWTLLIRSPAMRGLPPWRPDLAVPDLLEVAERRSGRPLSAGLPGAFTRAGWAVARDGAAARAVAAAGLTLGADPTLADPSSADPGTVAAVLGRLGDETADAWTDLLADLRVRPLRNRVASRQVTGLLARSPSPIDELIKEAWAAAGGGDLERPAEQQARIALALGPAIDHVQRGDAAAIADLFVELNAALGARGTSAALREERLRSAQRRFASAAALRRAPPLVQAVVGDVLAQTSWGQTAEARVEHLTNPLTARWQAEVFEPCRRAITGRFPFDPVGGDADPAELAALLGPGGALDRFIREAAAEWLDTAAQPWRWEPEARFEGLTPEGAEELQRLSAIGAGLFGTGGTAGGLGAEMGFAVLAESGRAEVSVGGTGAAVQATGGEVRLAWPGPTPEAGVVVTMETAAGPEEAPRPGPWGLLRLLSERRLRERDEGRRFLVDLRVGTGRLFLEVTFDSPVNPLKAVALARGRDCPATL